MQAPGQVATGAGLIVTTADSGRNVLVGSVVGRDGGWGGWDSVRVASTGFRARVVVVAAVGRRGGLWHGRWGAGH